MKVFILSGLIGSGKSTKSNYIKEKLDNTVIISKDYLRKMLHGKYEYDINYEPLINTMNFSLIMDALFKDYNVIIDETFLTKKSRLDIINKIRNVFKISNTEITIINCTETKNNLQNRIKHDLRGYSIDRWKNVLEEMKAIYEPATKKECRKLKVNYEEYTIKEN
jgi:predicted kinase